MDRICTRVNPLNMQDENMEPKKYMDVRIYYEDTDSGGVVYHANYIKFMERARTEYFREHGFSVAELAGNGVIFPVIRLEVDFKAPALHDDMLTVSTRPVRVSGSSITFFQKIICLRDNKLLVEGNVTLACINNALRARRIPREIRCLLEAELKKLHD